MSGTRSRVEVAVTRRCTGVCGRLLPLTGEWFNTAGTRRDGGVLFKSRCKVCTAALSRAYHAQMKASGRGPSERVPKLPARPLGERVDRAVALRVAGGEDADRVWRRIKQLSGITPRRVYAWQHEARQVTVTKAYEVLDALDLQLVDAYTPEQLAVLPKVELD